MLLSPPALDTPGAAGTVAVTGLTDSQVSAAVVTRGLTTAFPLCAVAMELAAQLERRRAELFLEWVPRDQNGEADRLADGCSTGFAESRRAHLELDQISWLVLPELLRTGQDFYDRVVREKKRKGKTAAAAGPVQKRKRQSLREREPW